MKYRLLSLVISLSLCLGVGVLGAYITTPMIAGWYSQLIKPTFTPPASIFGPVWTILYLFMGVSLFFILVSKRKNKIRKDTAISFFLVQLVLNFFWSIIFFRLHGLLFSLIEIVVLWLMILCTMYYSYRISRTACWLLLPYLLWVSFAAVLNFAFVLLNR